VVKLADLERGARELSVPIPEGWLRGALQHTDAVPLGDGKLEVELTKNGDDVLVRGRARVTVSVPCVVTLEPLRFELEPEVFLLLKPAPEASPRRRGPGSGKDPRPPDAPGEKPKQKRKRAREDPELSREEAAEDHYQGEDIVLDDFLREFIVLEIPPYPRRSDLPSSEESLSSRPLADPPGEKAIDPRLLPLLGLKDRLRG
jgi:uncharacterized metal-binding protein YceD (DUF177 family)